MAVLLVAVLILSVAFNPEERDVGAGASAYPFPVQTFEDQGRQHIAAGETFDGYNSNPPTSGPHGPIPAAGVHAEPVPKEQAVHFMEHGGVVVWYNCEAGDLPFSTVQCDTLRNQLAFVVQEALDDNEYVLMTPYAGMPRRVALTAWTTLDSFDEFDGTRVRAFIEAFECVFDPEKFCG